VQFKYQEYKHEHHERPSLSMAYFYLVHRASYSLLSHTKIISSKIYEYIN